VRWVIITIIFVFDPLAVLLLIASQYTFRWRYIDIHGEDSDAPKIPPAPKTPPKAPTPPPAPKPTGGQSLSKIVEKQRVVQTKPNPIKLSDIAEKKEIKTIPSVENTSEKEAQDIRRKQYEEKDKAWDNAKSAWKQANPDDTIHRHKELYIKGIIDTLPWENFDNEEPPMPLDQWNKMIQEAEKVAEQEAESKKKASAYIMRDKDQQVKRETQVE